MKTDDLRCKTFKIKLWEHCEAAEVKCRFASYRHNGTLAMELLCRPDFPIPNDGFNIRDEFCMPYGVATVNLDASGILPINVQFIDENNMPGLGRWLQQNKIAEPTRIHVRSGYVTYQAYAFNAPRESLSEVESRRRELGTLPSQSNNQRQNLKMKQ